MYLVSQKKRLEGFNKTHKSNVSEHTIVFKENIAYFKSCVCVCK